MPQSGVSMAIGRNTADIAAPAVPVDEINGRLLTLHDTLSSGIISYNSDDLRLEFTPVGPTPSGTQSIVTAVYFDAYDDTGGQTTSSTPITMFIAVERANSHPDIFVRNKVFGLTETDLQINVAGVYEFEYAVTCTTTGNTRSSHICTIRRRAPGGSYAEIPGSLSRNYIRSSAGGGGTATRKVILDDVVVGEQFQVRIVQVSNVSNTTTLADGSSLTVRKLA